MKPYQYYEKAIGYAPKDPNRGAWHYFTTTTTIYICQGYNRKQEIPNTPSNVLEAVRIVNRRNSHE